MLYCLDKHRWLRSVWSETHNPLLAGSFSQFGALNVLTKFGVFDSFTRVSVHFGETFERYAHKI